MSSFKEVKKIYAFGDSNTYGFDPRMGGMGRYPKDIRWTGVIDLMPEYEVNNQGYNGLSIPRADSTIASLGRSIKEWSPDLIFIMLGSNDLLNMSPASCEKVGGSMRQFLSALCGYIPEYVQNMVLVAPPKMSLGDWTDPEIVSESQVSGSFHCVTTGYILQRKPICLLPRKSFAILPESIVIELLDLLLERCRLDDYGISAETLEVFFQLKLRPVKVVQVSFNL